jgi:DNA invertase Pin-like site-specific DNA recombinase
MSLRAAIYGRKSSDNEQGVDRQVALAKDFIATQQGWSVADAHIYRDNDISGATFDRPGLNALLRAVVATPRPFDVLVMMDGRLGRDMEETLPLQGRITRAGVRIFHYQEKQELLLSTPVQKLVASVAKFSHEDFRYQIQLKTASALRKKAEQGHVPCGRCTATGTSSKAWSGTAIPTSSARLTLPRPTWCGASSR